LDRGASIAPSSFHFDFQVSSRGCCWSSRSAGHVF
jgi:hypothetical protein